MRRVTQIRLRFEGENIDIAISNDVFYTGEQTIILNWKDGKILKAEVSKRSSLKIEVPTNKTESSDS